MPYICNFALNSRNKIRVWHLKKFFEYLCTSSLFFFIITFIIKWSMPFSEKYDTRKPCSVTCEVPFATQHCSLSYYFALVNERIRPVWFYWNRQCWSVGLWQITYWDCGFEFRRGYACLSVVSVVFCQVGVSAAGRSLVQRISTECGVSECDFETRTMRSLPTTSVRPWKKYLKNYLLIYYIIYQTYGLKVYCTIISSAVGFEGKSTIHLKRSLLLTLGLPWKFHDQRFYIFIQILQIWTNLIT